MDLLTTATGNNHAPRPVERDINGAPEAALRWGIDLPDREAARSNARDHLDAAVLEASAAYTSPIRDREP